MNSVHHGKIHHLRSQPPQVRWLAHRSFARIHIQGHTSLSSVVNLANGVATGPSLIGQVDQIADIGSNKEGLNEMPQRVKPPNGTTRLDLTLPEGGRISLG